MADKYCINCCTLIRHEVFLTRFRVQVSLKHHPIRAPCHSWLGVSSFAFLSVQPTEQTSQREGRDMYVRRSLVRRSLAAGTCHA